MTNFQDYQITQQVHQGPQHNVYRALRLTDQKFVILKILKSKEPEAVARFKRAYNLLRNLTVEGVVRVEDMFYDYRQWCLVMTDFGGDSLTKLELAGTLTLTEFVELAREITEIVGQLHDLQVTHKELLPDNFIVRPPHLSPQKKWEVNLIDFDEATVIPEEHQVILAHTRWPSVCSIFRRSKRAGSIVLSITAPIFIPLASPFMSC